MAGEIKKNNIKKYNLAREIFDAPSPESFVRTLPAQSLYVTCLKRGLSSSSDIIELLTATQFRLFLDFDLWHKDALNEDKFWQWLELPDATSDLAILQKTLQSIDLKVLSFFFSKHIEVVTNEEPTEQAPGDFFSSPDKGYTWIMVTTEDETKNFSLKRLLALIFETDADLFYQLLNIPSVSTPSMLEEESYQDRQKRMSAEGIPSFDEAAAINAPVSIESLLKKLSLNKESLDIAYDIRSVRPLVYESGIPAPLRDLLTEAPSPENIETQLTLLLNSGCIFWGVNFSENENLETMTSFIRGAINIGLEALIVEANKNVIDIYKSLGLIDIYKGGLSLLMKLREKALNISSAQNSENIEEAILHGLRQSFPVAPSFIKKDGTIKAEKTTAKDGEPLGKLQGGYNAIEHLSLVNWLEKYLNNMSTQLASQ